MTDIDKKKLEAAHARARAAFNALPKAEKIKRLKQYGILDKNGNLAPRYRSSDSSKKAAS